MFELVQYPKTSFFIILNMTWRWRDHTSFLGKAQVPNIILSTEEGLLIYVSSSEIMLFSIKKKNNSTVWNLPAKRLEGRGNSENFILNVGSTPCSMSNTKLFTNWQHYSSRINKVQYLQPSTR